MDENGERSLDRRDRTVQETGWDGMGQDGTGWDRMGQDGTVQETGQDGTGMGEPDRMGQRPDNGTGLDDDALCQHDWNFTFAGLSAFPSFVSEDHVLFPSGYQLRGD